MEGIDKKALWILSAATFLIFFQAFMLAPLIPLFTEVFNTDEQTAGLIIPAYMIPYGIATLAYGLLSDKYGRHYFIKASMLALVVLSAATILSATIDHLILWRAATAIGASAVVPLTLTLIGDRYPFEKRGEPLGIIFAAMAGGIAAGKTLGVLAVPLIDWQGLFLAIAAIGLGIFFFLIRHRGSIKSKGKSEEDHDFSARKLLNTYKALMVKSRGWRTYGYVLLNSIFHGGVYTWLGVYFSQRYGLEELGIGLAIIGYGIPGFVFGKLIGRLADKYGRKWILPAGLAVGAVAAAGLIPNFGVVYAAIVVMILSVGFALTQPLFAGIVTELGGRVHGGQAMGLNVFLLFTGFGSGSYLFGELIVLSFNEALIIFAALEIMLAAGAVFLFKGEKPK